MAQWVKGLVAKPDGLSFDLWYPHIGRRELTPTSHPLSFDIHTNYIILQPSKKPAHLEMAN